MQIRPGATTGSRVQMYMREDQQGIGSAESNEGTSMISISNDSHTELKGGTHDSSTSCASIYLVGVAWTPSTMETLLSFRIVRSDELEVLPPGCSCRYYLWLGSSRYLMAIRTWSVLLPSPTFLSQLNHVDDGA